MVTHYHNYVVAIMLAISQFLQLITTRCCSVPDDDDPMGLEAVDPGDTTYHFGDDTLEEIHR